MSAFKSPFEKLSYEAQAQIADSVSPGGDMYNLLEDIADNIRKQNTREGSVEKVSLFGGLTVKEAMAWTILGEKGLDAIAKGLGSIAKVIDGMGSSGEEAKEKMEGIVMGITAIKGLGKAILEFAGYLLLATPLLVVGILAAPLFALSIFVITKALVWASKPLTSKESEQAIEAIEGLGYTLFIFGGLLALSALIWPTAITALPYVVLSILTLGVTFYLIDKLKVETAMEKVSAALIVASIGILFLGGALAVFGYLFPPTQESYETLALIGAAVGGISLILFAVGKGASHILQGALVLILAGISLIPLAIGMSMFADAFSASPSPWEFFGWTMAVISGVGLAMTGLGALVALTAGAAFLGPLMIAAIGGSLIALAAGLIAFQKVNWTDEDTTKLTTALAGVKAAFMGTEKEEGGFFGAIGGALKGALDSGKIIAAAAGYSAAGLALILLSKGLIKYKEVGWKDEDSLELTRMLQGVSLAFASAGGGELVQGGGFFDTMFGTKRNKVQEGILSVMEAGSALTGIAHGLMSFKKLIDSGIEFGAPDELGNYPKGTLGYAVVNTMGFINQAFSAVAEQGNVDAGGFFGSLFGIKKNKVAEGIESVSGSGEVLKNVADGLIGFQNLVQKDIDWDALGDSIVKTMGFVNQAFAAVAEEGNVDAGGFFGTLFAIKKNKVTEGIDSVSGAGETLNSIADALNKFKGLEDPNAIASKIEGVIGIVGNSFSQVEKFEDVDEMIDLFEAAAEMYEDIADASNDMNIEAINSSTKMFEALGYLSENGGANSIELLGENLIEAIRELALMIANFEGTVGEAQQSNQGLIESVGSLFGSDDKEPAKTTTEVSSANVLIRDQNGDTLSQEEVVFELKRLYNLLTSGDAIVQTQANIL